METDDEEEEKKGKEGRRRRRWWSELSCQLSGDSRAGELNSDKAGGGDEEAESTKEGSEGRERWRSEGMRR